MVDAIGGGRSTIAGERVDVRSATHIADVFACVNFISELVGSLPLKVYYEDPNGVKVEAPQHRAYRMLHDAPNPVVPAHRFWSSVTADLLLYGNAFIEKLRDENGLVSELWLYPPSHVVVEWNDVAREKRFKIIGGVAPWSGVATNATTTVKSADDILHIYGATVDGLIGMSPIQQSREALGIAKARERFEGDVYAKKPFLTGVINHPNQLRDTVKLRESWSAIYGGQGDTRHGVAVLEEGATFQQLSMPLADMQFVESQKLSRTQIATIFKLPPAFIGGAMGDSLTYQTVESNSTWLARYTLAPVCVNIQRFLAFDRGIFPFNAWEPEFVLDALLRGDSAARASYYKTMGELGAMTVNEMRDRENLPPLPETTPLLTPSGKPFTPDPFTTGPEVDPTESNAGATNGTAPSPVMSGQVQIPAHTRRPPTTTTTS